jgi:hypothetical protein
VGSAPMSLQVSIRDAMTAPWSPPPSEPAKRAFFRFRATGRIAVEIEALPRIDLRLPLERQVIGVFGYEHLGHRRFGGQSTLDKSRRRECLHHHVLTSPAGIFGPANDEHAELRRHDVELLARIVAYPMQRVAATRRASQPRCSRRGRSRPIARARDGGSGVSARTRR